jgi:hypothetical protein
MNRLKMFGLSIVLALGAIAAAPAPAAAQVHASVNVSFFYDSLAPYGQWVNNASYGYVWHPANVAVGWRPYMNGRWLYTNAGWGFDSSEPWGWATFHYGRWAFDPYYGWIWVPGTVWSPAWVDFQVGTGWIGWAALPPGVAVGASFGYAGGYGGYRSHIDPRGYNFVDDRRFLDSRVDRYITPWDSNQRYLRASSAATRFTTYNGVTANRGLPVERVERSLRRAVPRVPIVDVASYRDIASRRDSGFAAYRPSVRATADHRPAVVAAPVAQRRSAVVDTRGGRARVVNERVVAQPQHIDTRRNGASARHVEPRPQSPAVTSLLSSVRQRHEVHTQQNVKRSTTAGRNVVSVQPRHVQSQHVQLQHVQAQHRQPQRVTQQQSTVRSRQVEVQHGVRQPQAAPSAQHAQASKKPHGNGHPHGG